MRRAKNYSFFENNDFLLKEFNKKYNLNIKNTKVDLLNLNRKKIGNEGLKDLWKIELRELKDLLLYDNNISDLSSLIKA